MTSGCVDAISFLGLGQVFTAAMTGNTVLFGLALAHTDGLSPMRYAIALFGFILGAAIASVIVRRNQKETGWGRTVTMTICLELAALLVFALICMTSTSIISGGKADILVILLGVSMGIQGVAARRVGINGVTTTVITSTLTGLVESVIWSFGSSIEFGSRSKQGTHSDDKARSMITWFSVILAYGVGAAICGSLQRYWHFQAIWLPISLVSLVIVTAIGLSLGVKSKTEMSM